MYNIKITLLPLQIFLATELIRTKNIWMKPKFNHYQTGMSLLIFHSTYCLRLSYTNEQLAQFVMQSYLTCNTS